MVRSLGEVGFWRVGRSWMDDQFLGTEWSWEMSGFWRDGRSLGGGPWKVGQF